MKGIIIYASRTGNTELICNRLKEQLNTDFKIQNIIQENNIDIAAYDVIVIGTYMRRQQADPEIIEFVNRNKDKLLKKKLFIFVSAGEVGETYRREIRNSFPKEILENIDIINVGAIFSLDKLNFVDKVMVQEMAKRQGKILESMNSFNEEKLAELAKLINSYDPATEEEPKEKEEED